MKKKINTGFMLIAAIAIVVTAVCSMFLFYQILEEQIFDDLKASAHVVSVISPNELSKDITYSLENDGLRITCVDTDGTVLYDSMEDASSMENHKDLSGWSDGISDVCILFLPSDTETHGTDRENGR